MRAGSILLIGLIGISCTRDHRSTIIGSWSGENVTITKGKETISAPIDKYGYLNLLLNRDSTYTLSLAVLKDVRVEKKIFGVTANTVLIPAIYKSTRYGKWMRTDNGCTLSSQEGVISISPLTDNETLVLNFTDADGRAWKASLEPKE
jgi:hypothetical protein